MSAGQAFAKLSFSPSQYCGRDAAACSKLVTGRAGTATHQLQRLPTPWRLRGDVVTSNTEPIMLSYSSSQCFVQLQLHAACMHACMNAHS
jgi:hypothetical protein